MEIVWFATAVIVILVIQYVTGQARRRRQLVQRLQAQWGQVPDREYLDGDLRRIARYYEMSHSRDPQKLVVDDITWNDLGMDEIFMLLNHTQSSVGEEALYRMLRMPETDPAVLQERAHLAQVFTRDEELRLALEMCLHRIGKTGGQAFCDYISAWSQQPKRSNLRHYLGLAAMAASLGVMTVAPYYGGLALILVIAFQIVTYYRQKAQVESFFVCVSQVVRLTRCAQDICTLARKVDGSKTTKHGKDSQRISEGASTKEEHASVADNEMDRYIETLQTCIHKLAPICRKAGAIATGQTMGGSLLDLVADYVKMLLHTDLMAYNQILSLLKKVEPEIWQMIDVVGQLECGLAIASFRQCLGQWCEPELVTDYSLYLHGEDLYHPLVDHAVPNTIRAERCQLITGSNASGKSTFLKTVAINAVLAQTIYTVAGSSYQAPFYQIYSSMALKDDLVGGESYYMVEIRSLKRILDHGQDELPVLCFVDEVLRGTNTVERIAASAQILKSMTQRSILCFAATHDGELTYLLEECYENGHFSETITEGDVRFSYRLQPGRAVGRNALQLLGLMGYDEEVLREARDMAARFDRTGIWSMSDES